MLKRANTVYPDCSSGSTVFANSVIVVFGALRVNYWTIYKIYSLHLLQGMKIITCTCTVMTLSVGTNRSEQTVQPQIRLLIEEQSDLGLHCLLFHLHLFDEIP